MGRRQIAVMGSRRFAAMGMVGVLLGAGSLLASSAGASATVAAKPATAGCTVNHDDKWPDWVNGRPTNVDPKTAAGVYMWHDGAGWHIRATHRSYARQTFGGKIVTSGRFFRVSAVRLEGRDWLHVSPDHRVITFRFVNHGAIDGLNFRTYCAPSITFAFGSGGKVLPAEAVTIGHDGTKPASVPFTVDRSA